MKPLTPFYVTEEEIRTKRLKGTTKEGAHYADWQHRHEEATTQEEADNKLVAYFKGQNCVVDKPRE